MEKSTVLTDPDGVIMDVAPIPQGRPYAEDAVAIRSEGGRTAWVSAAELIAVIEKAAGIEKLTVTQAPTIDDGSRWWKSGAEPETLWTEVRERPARAAKVTEEFVRNLLESPVDGLEARFYAKTGSPRGVAFWSQGGLGQEVFVRLGDYVALRPGQDPQVLKGSEFEAMYEEVA